MAAVYNTAGHYIFVLWFLLLSFFFLFSSPNQPSHIGCLPYFHTWCGPSANLECRSDVGCTWLAEMQDAKKIAKNSPSGHHHTNLSDYIFPSKARIDNRKKLIKQQYRLHMSSEYGELWSINGLDPLASLGHPCKFQRVSRLGSVTARQSTL